jgi:hypothetical protein
MKRHSISNELIYSQFKTQGKWEDIESTNNFRTRDYTLSLAYIKLNNLYRIQYPLSSPRNTMFFNFGISNGLGIVLENSNTETVTFHSSETTNEKIALDHLKSYQLGAIVGVGARFNRLFVEFRYELGNDLTKIISLSTHTNRGFFLVGYQL